MQKNQFVEYVRELLEPFGEIKARAMFGGYGVYKDGLIIAIIVQDELYLKCAKGNQDYFKSFNSEPFSYYTKNGKLASMSYWKVVPEVMEDEDLFAKWVDIAIGASTNSKGK